MKHLSTVIGVVLMLTTLATANMAFAGIDDSFDWKGQKRKLKVFYDFDAANDKLGDKKMKDIMDEAIKNWNDVKADTGWEFVSGGTSADHDIRIKVDGNLNGGGGASTTGFPAAGDKNREVSELTITFDPTPQSNDGTKFEWDTAGKNKDDTKNPVSNAKHELSHTLRLDHQGGTRSESKKIKDPQGKVTKNDDVTTISQDDKDEAKKASTAAIKVASAPAGPGTDVLLAVSGFPMEIPIPVITPDATLSIPGSAFLNDVLVSFSRTSLYSMPAPFDTPSEVDHMVKGVHIDITGQSQRPLLTDSLFTLTIPYEDGVEGDGFLIDIADPDYGSIIESTLRPFIYNPLSANWQSIDPFSVGGSYSLDTVNDFATIALPSNLLYSFPNLDDSSTGTLFISISGATVPEPATLFLLGSGLVAMSLLRRRRVGATEELDEQERHAVRTTVGCRSRNFDLKA